MSSAAPVERNRYAEPAGCPAESVRTRTNAEVAPVSLMASANPDAVRVMATTSCGVLVAKISIGVDAWPSAVISVQSVTEPLLVETVQLRATPSAASAEVVQQLAPTSARASATSRAVDPAGST